MLRRETRASRFGRIATRGYEEAVGLSQEITASIRELIARQLKRRVVLKPYINSRSIWRKLIFVGLLMALSLFSLVYGFFFALTAPYLITQFAAPVAVLAVFTIWALPDLRMAPTRTTERFYLAFLVSLLLWPNYLAIALPGLPWITVLRLTGLPMAAAFLVCLSTSREYRHALWDSLQSTPLIWQFLLIFSGLQFATAPLSNDLAASLQKATIQQVYWSVILLASCYIFQKPGRVERYLILICTLAVPIALLTMLEGRLQRVLWEGHVPSFLKIDDAARILQATMRSADGVYRAKATFSTPLGLAEFMALTTPFFLHFALNRYHVAFRALSAVMILVAFYCVQLSGSRLGNVGMLVSVMLYVLLWGVVRWRERKHDLTGPIIVLSYPAVAIATLVASLFWRRLNVMLLGGGAHKASNEARMRQLDMSLPKIVKNPAGHGAGQAGDSMGYAEGKFVALDNHYLMVGLDYGVLGLIAFHGIIVAAMFYAVRDMLVRKGPLSREDAMLIPIAVCLAAFLVIKWVFAQEDNHPLIFALVGMVVALIYRRRALPLASRDERVVSSAVARRRAHAFSQMPNAK